MCFGLCWLAPDMKKVDTSGFGSSYYGDDDAAAASNSNSAKNAAEAKEGEQDNDKQQQQQQLSETERGVLKAKDDVASVLSALLKAKQRFYKERAALEENQRMAR